MLETYVSLTAPYMTHMFIAGAYLLTAGLLRIRRGL